MPELRESPQWVKTSLAGAICLGLERGQFLRNARSTCLNILLTYANGCRASCSYCGLACNRQTMDGQSFIRVKWPSYPMEQILYQIKQHPHPFNRICVSMITHANATQDSISIIKQIRQNTDLPISILASPSVMNGQQDLQRLKDAGADRIGIAVDTANEALFEEHRGKGGRSPHRWNVYWQSVRDAVDIFGPGHVGVHLIVGLGETEEEMVKTIDRAYAMGAMTHLFSFFPEKGSKLQYHPQPPMGQYRRVQMARYLINQEIIRANDICFNEIGKIEDYGVNIKPYLQEGLAFMTSGCPGKDGHVACNRPFANERVNQDLRNYPFMPETDDIEMIGRQFWDRVEAHE